MQTPLPARIRFLGAACALALTTAVSLASCSSDKSPSPSNTEPSSVPSNADSDEPPIGTSADIGRIIGKMPGARRKATRLNVTEVVESWWNNAYLRPTDFDEAFPAFTEGAKKRARADKDLLTNLDVSARADQIAPKRQRLLIDVLAVNGTARAATARFTLRYTVEGDELAADEEGLVEVRGRLMLTHRPSGWRVFGYDVRKGKA